VGESYEPDQSDEAQLAEAASVIARAAADLSNVLAALEG
jgi:hypothetical protein